MRWELRAGFPLSAHLSHEDFFGASLADGRRGATRLTPSGVVHTYPRNKKFATLPVHLSLPDDVQETKQENFSTERTDRRPHHFRHRRVIPGSPARHLHRVGTIRSGTSFGSRS